MERVNYNGKPIYAHNMDEAFWHTIEFCKKESDAVEAIKVLRASEGDYPYDMIFGFITEQGLFDLLPDGSDPSGLDDPMFNLREGN